MKIIKDIASLKKELRKYENKTIGLVPTMGYLHEGHISLIKTAKKECECIVLSIFVNPLQFGKNEDLERYPRDLKRDCAIAEKEGVTLLFCPDETEMYPSENVVEIHFKHITNVLCGLSRPGHFEGVALVVMKLFHIISPQKAYFGIKDAQQVVVVTKCVEDLHFPISIITCPIVREGDGLALSSRNVYLTKEERGQSQILSLSLKEVASWLREGSIYHANDIVCYVRKRIQTMPLSNIEYIEVLAYPTLEKVGPLSNQTILIALAVRFGKTRLIDNLIFNLEERKIWFAP